MGSKSRRRWSLTEKLEILSSSQKEGVIRASRQYGVSTTMIYKWQKAFADQGEEGLTSQKQKEKEIEYHRLLRENNELKSLVAEKELQIRIQTEIIKKNQLLNWKRS